MGADVDVLGAALGTDDGGGTGAEPISPGEETPFVPEGETAEPISGEGGEGGERQPTGEEVGAEGGEALPPWEEVKEVVPKSVYQAAKFLKTEHPDQAPAIRELVNAYGMLQGHKGVYPTVEAARLAQATLQTFGGFEGLTKLQEVQERAAEVDDMLDRGDPSMLDQMAKASPKGFSKLVPEALSRLERMDPEAHRQALLAPTLAMFNKAGLPYALRMAMDELKSGTAEGVVRAGKWIEDTQSWLASIKSEHDGIQNQYKDPRINEFQKERETFQETQRTAFLSELDRHMNDHMRETIRPELMQRMRASGQKLSQKALEDMENAAMIEIRKSLAKDNFFVSSVKAQARSRNMENSITFVRPQIDMQRSNAIKTVWTTRYGTAPVRTRTNSTGTGIGTQRTGASNEPLIPTRGAGTSVQSPVPVRVKPPLSELDMSKDQNQMHYINGRGFHKASNKWITWRPGRAR